MLKSGELRQFAQRSGARDLGKVEIDVILTYLLQLFHDRKVTEHLAFKGGTLLRKMYFGPRGRLSTDLDFTCRSDCSMDDLMGEILSALDSPYEGLTFRIERDKDWYFTEDGIAANPVCSHDDNPKGVKIKLQVSTRETPILPVKPQPQLALDYFRFLPFKPADIPSLAFEEAVAEKLRAASQRSKIRDLHDLSEIAKLALDQPKVRGLAVLKLWRAGEAGLDYAALRKRLQETADFDEGDLRDLLRKDENPSLKAMVDRVVQGFAFLQNLTEAESTVAADRKGGADEAAAAIRAALAA
jgi:predicted nucleotidyltransferase component of viral defense system